MNGNRPAGTEDAALAQRVDAACDRFEEAWHGGARSPIEDFLADAAETDRSELFRELLILELKLYEAAGERRTPDQYRGRFAAYARQLDEVFGSAPTVPYDVPPHAIDATPPVVTPAPERIGRYRVQRLLGEGTYGTVYMAHDDVMDIDVAVKVPTARLLATADAKAAFLNEVRSVARLRHENIVRVYDFGEQPDGQCYITYEYVDGMSLAQRLQQGSMSIDEGAAVVAKVADALHHAHLAGLFHRDVKPENILLDRRGRPRVADFGLAVREEELAKQRGLLVGTYAYLSPEQVRREGHLIDGRTDVYSLGVVLYELLCKRRPFEAKTKNELVDQILNREAKPPRQIDDAIPRALEKVCLKALAKRVADRYATARDMAEMVLGALDQTQGQPSELDAPITAEEIERRMASGDERELRAMLRVLARQGDVTLLGVPHVLRCVAHPSDKVRQEARRTIHAIGWDKVGAASVACAERADAMVMAGILDGLAAFEAHPQTVALLDRLVIAVQGDLRNRAIQLLERKRLGMELDSVAELFRSIHSPYRIEKALGQGLFTASYLARVEGGDLRVVVRVLRNEFACQPHVRAHFLELGHKSSQVVHENLALTREVRAFTDRGVYFLVRDYVDGVTLQKVLDGGKRFDPPQIVRLLRQLSAGMGAVHRHKLWHGGIKPSNAFVCDGDRVVLGDPGLHVPGIGLNLERLSYDYRYVAPETFRGGPVTHHADFYSLGCMAYELACGSPPFVADNHLELAAQHTRDAIVCPSERGSRLGPMADDLLLRLLARSPNDRLADREEFVNALDHVLEPVLGLRKTKTTAPLLRDASVVRYQGAESMVVVDPSQAEPTNIGVPEHRSEISDGDEEGVRLPPSMMRCLPSSANPTKIGNYEILGRLGSGGMGVVYKARDERLDRIVALKMLPTRMPEAFGRRFHVEAMAVAKIRHPNVVQIYDVGEEKGQAYLVLEYVEAGTLADKLRQQRGMPSREAVQLVIQLAKAIQHAHERGVLHRDLKPANVLLTPEGQPKITDFGLAKITEMAMDATSTRTGTILGTPAYMAPEQAIGNVERIGPAADTYSLGAILYELLTAQPPFKGASAFETLSYLATRTAVPVRDLNANVDPQLNAIVMKALEKSPEQRYASAADFAADLQLWLTGQPVSAKAQPGWQRALKRLMPFRRNS